MSRNEQIFLTVRTGSKRLPKKCLLPFGENTVLEFVINRVKKAGFDPIICTSTSSDDDELEVLGKRINTNIFRGSLNNKVSRWLDCALQNNIEIFHTIDVDDPFFDPRQVEESLNLLKNENLDIVHPTLLSSLGSASVGYSIRTNAIKQEKNLIQTFAEIEMVDVLFHKLNNLKQKTLVTEFTDYPDIRLTLDYQEDYWLLLFILKQTGPESARDDILNLFIRNPDLREFNLFRNNDWIVNQNLQRAEFENASV